MDIANKNGGLVIGTGDMSELALGWATYNGDHMSMYGVNVGVPKTLVRHLVQYYADTCNHEAMRNGVAGYSGYTGQPGASSTGGWCNFTKDRRSRRDRMSFMISSYIICCVADTRLPRYTESQNCPLQEYMRMKLS